MMDRIQPENAAAAAAPAAQSSPPGGCNRRAGLWRAIAGMAVALAIACSIVWVEMSEELIGKVANYHFKIVNLQRRLNALRRDEVSIERRIGGLRKSLVVTERMETILLASDLRTIKLTPPHQDDLASGTVSISQKTGGAVLAVIGLPAPPEGQIYQAWWVTQNGAPTRAGKFASALDGAATVYLQPPAPGSGATSCEITLEASADEVAPKGAVKLQGRISDERSATTSKR